LLLARHCYRKKNWCVPGITTLCRLANATDKTFKRHVERLGGSGLAMATDRGGPETNYSSCVVAFGIRPFGFESLVARSIARFKQINAPRWEMGALIRAKPTSSVVARRATHGFRCPWRPSRAKLVATNAHRRDDGP